MAEAITGPVTEIVYIPLKSSFDYNNASDKAVVEATVEKVATLGGVNGLFWGFQIENPLTLQMVVDWENLDGHKAFIDSPDYQPFLDHLGTITSDVQAVPFHIRAPVGKGGVDPRDAPVTECVGAYFDPATDQEKWTNENWQPFKAQAEKIPDTGLHGLLGGWSIEGHKHEYLGEGVEGKFHAAFLGWPSVEAHMKFREREEFKQVIPLFRSGTTALKVHHVALKRRI